MILSFESFIITESISQDDVNALENKLENDYGIELWLSYRMGYNVIILSKIVVPKDKRNKGIGSKVMNAVCDFADQHGIRVALTPTTDFGASKARLTKFYRSFDFMPYKGFEFRETMVRDPKK